MPDQFLPIIQPGSDRAQADRSPVFGRIGIVGLGLIGGSIALATRQAWPSALVIAVDDKTVLEKAMVLHAIDVAADDMVAIAEADLVILSAPIEQNLRRLEEIDAHVPGPAVVTDVSSTKRLIVEAARTLPPRFAFVGGHPLGGAARSGIEFARPDLFRGRPWLFTPTDERAGAALGRLFTFVQGLGARPQVIDPSEHDRLLAFLSHLPQLTASALMHVVGEHVGDAGLTLAGRGLQDTTRLATSPASVWRDVCRTNADRVGQALDLLIDLLRTLRDDLREGEQLERVFESSRSWKERLMTQRDAE